MMTAPSAAAVTAHRPRPRVRRRLAWMTRRTSAGHDDVMVAMPMRKMAMGAVATTTPNSATIRMSDSLATVALLVMTRTMTAAVRRPIMTDAHPPPPVTPQMEAGAGRGDMMIHS